MTDLSEISPVKSAQPLTSCLRTPAGLQATAELARRRNLVLVLNVATVILLLSLAASVLGTGGWTVVGWIIFLCFAVSAPWSVLGFWNCVIGLWLRHVERDPLSEVAPFLDAGAHCAPVSGVTAVVMTLRNEDPARAIARFRAVKASLDATGSGGAFAYFVLSDTDRSEIAALEEACVAAWQSEAVDTTTIVYRRRTSNAGFKAGNIRAFCEAQGRAHELMVLLDADSLMAGGAIVSLVQIMQAFPRIGILQTLVVGGPSSSAFARMFQFGMRLGMRTYTMGQSWWTADCGPFWGHNAIVRVGPFRDECALPVLAGGPPFGGHVLSHDQVEAALMRRAGYEVRVIPVEGGSWEDNPPTMLDFLTRDVRWCQGNLQYGRLLDLPGLLPMGRFQLIWAMLMFVGQPAFTLMIALSPLAAWHFASVQGFPAARAAGLYVAFLFMSRAPQTTGFLDALLTPGEVARFGGGGRFVVGGLVELVFAFLQSAVSALRITIFLVGLFVLGRSIGWQSQARDTLGLSWSTAARTLWPMTVFGLAVCVGLGLTSATVLAWSLPLTAGYLLAIPLCVLSADPRAGAWMKSRGLAGIPEDFDTPSELAAVSGRA